MKHRTPVMIVGLLAAIVALAWTAGRLWRQQERQAVAWRGVPALPEMSRWPVEFAQLLGATTREVASALQPEVPLARLAALYYVNGFSAQAKQVLTTLRELEPRQARWPYLLAALDRRSGETTGVEENLLATVQLDPTCAPAWLRLGLARAERNELVAAREALAQATLADPGNLRAEASLISFEVRQEKRKVDPPRIRALLEAHPGIRQLHEIMAEVLAVAGDEAGAAQHRQLAAKADIMLEEIDPWVDELALQCYDSNRLSLLATDRFRTGRFAEANDLLARALRFAPNDATLWKLRFDVLRKMNQPELTLAVLRQAVEACPDDADLRIQLAWMLGGLQRLEESLAVIRAGMARSPRAAVFHEAMGRILRDRKDYAGAVLELAEAIRLDPHFVEAHHNLGLCQVALGNREQAKQSFATALAIRPENTETLQALGSLAVEAGDIADAEQHIGTLYGIKPDDPGAQLLFAVVHLMKGMKANDEGRVPEAGKLFQDGLAIRPEFGPLLRESGLLAARQSRWPEALGYFDRLVKVEPDQAAHYLLLGQALRQAGRPGEARAIFERGLHVAETSGAQAEGEELKRWLAR